MSKFIYEYQCSICYHTAYTSKPPKICKECNAEEEYLEYEEVQLES